MNENTTATATTIITTEDVGTTPTTVINTQDNVIAPIAPSFDRAAFIAQYNEGKSPKQRKVPCTATGHMVTIFGANLKRRIEKHGSVETFLNEFVSRKAASKKNKTTQA